MRPSCTSCIRRCFTCSCPMMSLKLNTLFKSFLVNEACLFSSFYGWIPNSSFLILRFHLLINLSGHFADAVGCSYRVEVQAGHSVVDELAALLDAPLDAHVACLVVVGAFQQFVGQLFGQVYLEGLGYHAELRQLLEGLDAGNDGNGDSLLAGALYETEVLAIVVEELCDGIFGAGLHLLFSQYRSVSRLGASSCFSG